MRAVTDADDDDDDDNDNAGHHSTTTRATYRQLHAVFYGKYCILIMSLCSTVVVHTYTFKFEF